MKKILFILLLTLTQTICAQPPMVRHLQVVGKIDDENPLNSIGVVSVFDYARSLSDSRTFFSSDTDTTLKYIYLSSDSSSFAITEAESLEELLTSQSKWKDLLVLVHGYGDDIIRLANREPLLVDMYNFDVLAFHWPAKMEAGGKVQNFRATRDTIAATMPLFYAFLDELSTYVRSHNIKCSMMFHSLGNRYAMLLGQDLAKKPLPLRADLSFIDNVVLNEACVPLEGYLDWAGPLSESITGRLSITYNKNDVVLAVARSFSEKQPLLGQGPTKKYPFVPRPNSPSAATYPSASAIRYIDFTKTLLWVDPHFSHNFYVRQPLDNPAKAREITSTFSKLL